MSAILVGATSWTERTLIESGRFYPPEIRSAEGRLRFYAVNFSITEVDSSYYGLPSERNAVLWAERTPESFVFDIKAFRLFTHHQTPLDALPPDVREVLGVDSRRLYYRDVPEELLDELWSRFRSALEPLRAAGKLGVVLFQFPPWFVRRGTHLDYLAELSGHLPEDRVAVEFRHRSWFAPERAGETLAFEREHGLIHVVVDEPQGSRGSIPAVWEVTAPTAVVRLHGRNRATWQRRGLETAAQRFDYLYSEEELHELVAPVQGLARRAELVHVLFNNCRQDYAPRNAARFRTLLSDGV